jgi:hypothetical protein
MKKITEIKHPDVDDEGYTYYGEEDLQKDEWCPKCGKRGEVYESGECGNDTITSSASCEKCKTDWDFLGIALDDIKELPIAEVDADSFAVMRTWPRFVAVSNYAHRMKIRKREVGYLASVFGEEDDARLILTNKGVKGNMIPHCLPRLDTIPNLLNDKK